MPISHRPPFPLKINRRPVRAPWEAHFYEDIELAQRLLRQGMLPGQVQEAVWNTACKEQGTVGIVTTQLARCVISVQPISLPSTLAQNQPCTYASTRLFFSSRSNVETVPAVSRVFRGVGRYLQFKKEELLLSGEASERDSFFNREKDRFGVQRDPGQCHLPRLEKMGLHVDPKIQREDQRVLMPFFASLIYR